MTTPIVITGFEYGLTPVISGGGLCNNVWGTPGTEHAIESTTKRTGSYSLKIAPTAATRGAIGWNLSTPTVVVYRFYINIASAPTGDASIAHIAPSAGNYPLLILTSTGKFAVGYSNGNASVVGTEGPAFSTGTWYRVDLSVDVSANPNVVKARVDGGTEFSYNIAQAATTLTSARLGTHGVSGPAYTSYFDDVMLSVTSADYPIGAGQVEAVSPDADGTHNAGTNVIEDQAGADIGVVTAWNLLDNVPLNTTADYVQQAATGTGNYAEVTFADTVRTTINGVSALLAYMAASATADNGQTRVIRSDATEITVYSGDMSETSLFYKSAIVTPPAGGWTQAEVNALKARVGYSSDANPIPQWHALMLELDVVAGGAPPSGCPRQADYYRRRRAA